MNELIIFCAKYLIFVLIVIAFAFFAKQNREEQKKLFIFALVVLPIAYIVAKIASVFYYDARPFVVENFTPLISHVADNGFPSDHTLLSSSIAMLVYFFNKKLGLALLVLALLVGISRVLAGVHHAVDIAGSFTIVIFISFIVYKLVLPVILKSEFCKKFKAS